MIWSSPSWMPQEHSIPSDVTVGDFCLEARNVPSGQSDVPTLITAHDGRSFSIADLRARVDHLAAGLSDILTWSSDDSRTPWDKAVALFAVNSVDYFSVCWAVHRLGGICLLLHPTSTASEIKAHLARVKCQAFFTSTALSPIVEQALHDGASVPEKAFLIGTVDEASMQSQRFPTLEYALQNAVLKDPWSCTPASGQVAFLCPTSGTSGAQKLAKMTHENVIANIILTRAVDDVQKQGRTEVALEMLPLSHIYGILISHIMLWRHDTMILHEIFDMQKVLKSIVQYRIERLYLVPSIVAALVTNKILFKAFDFSSVKSITTGGGGLSAEMGAKLRALQPTWDILAGYGTTESGGLATFTGASDVFLGSSGSLLPTMQARILQEDGTIAEDYELPGEILVKSASVVAGYLDGQDDGLMTPDGWLRTGDVGLFRKSPAGNDHLFVVDRLKDMLKVKGVQVAPADIEGALMKHPDVAEAAVIGQPHDLLGEQAKAFVVCKQSEMTDADAESLRESLRELVQGSLPETHWLGNRIVFLKALPKSSGGKLLKRLLKKGEFSVA